MARVESKRAMKFASVHLFQLLRTQSQNVDYMEKFEQTGRNDNSSSACFE